MTIQSQIAKVIDRQQASLVFLLIAIWIAFWYESSSFLTQSNILLITLQSAATIISAVGMTYVVSTRGIDLSVGGIAVCSAAVAVVLSNEAAGQHAFDADVSLLAVPVALLTGLLLGLLNAVSVSILKINPLIATLGSMALFRGLGLHLISASSIQLSGTVIDVVRASFLGVGIPIIVAVLFSILAAIVVWQTPFGRKMLAIGQSPRSAVETGISMKGILFVAYGLSGLCAAIAGIVMIGRVGQLDATVGVESGFRVHGHHRCRSWRNEFIWRLQPDIRNIRRCDIADICRQWPEYNRCEPIPVSAHQRTCPSHSCCSSALRKKKR